MYYVVYTQRKILKCIKIGYVYAVKCTFVLTVENSFLKVRSERSYANIIISYAYIS